MPGVIDHVAEGLARLRPVRRGDPRFVAWMTVLLQQLQHVDDLLVALAELYTLGHDRAPLWMLIQIGGLLGLPYTPGLPKAVYRQLLRARVLARKSRGRYNDVAALASTLSAPGTVDKAGVVVTHPEALTIEIPNLTPAIAARARSILLGAIQETTQLSVIAVNDTEGGLVDGLWFTLDDGPGFDEGMLGIEI